MLSRRNCDTSVRPAQGAGVGAQPPTSTCPDGTTRWADNRLLERFRRAVGRAERTALAFTTPEGPVRLSCAKKSRWTAAGRKARRARLRRQIDHHRGVAVLLTLTADPADDPREAAGALWGRWGGFRDRLNRRLRRRGEPPLRAVVGLEFDDAGRPHLHVLVPGRARVAAWSEMKGLWGPGNVDARIVPAQRGLRYVTKPGPVAEDAPPELREAISAWCWAHRLRLYSIAPHLRARRRCRATGWRFVGLVSWRPADRAAEARARARLAAVERAHTRWRAPPPATIPQEAAG